jgi:hypothetical protein
LKAKEGVSKEIVMRVKRGVPRRRLREEKRTMNTVNIDNPVLVFSPRYDTVEFIRDKDLISVTNKLGLKRGIVIGNLIVDSSGKVFKTISAKKKSNYYPIWKFEFFNPLIYIELEVKKIKDEFDLKELKERVLKIVNKDKDEWTNYGDVEKIKRTIEGSQTHRELIDTIGSYVRPLTKK